MKRNFEDKDKAYIFKRDRGICAFSGKNLWILESGIINWDWDWVDHITPYSKGGKSIVENGILLSSKSNYMLSSHSRKYYLFENGIPNSDFYALYGSIDKEHLKILEKHSNLDIADWYFNRAVALLLLGLERKLFPYKNNGEKATRDLEYYIKASMKQLINWNKINNERDDIHIGSFKERGLLPKKPEIDQSLLFQMTKITEINDIKTIINQILPIFKFYHLLESKVDELSIFLLESKKNLKSPIKILDTFLKKSEIIKELLYKNESLPRHKKMIKNRLKDMNLFLEE